MCHGNIDITVLLVDDDETFKDFATLLLEERGFHVLSAGNGAQALSMVRDNNVDVVVLDLRLPDIDGNEVLRDIKIIDPKVEVIMLTAYGTIQSALTAMRDDVFEFLAKPCTMDLLEETICNAVDKKNSPWRARWYDMWAQSELKVGYL